MRLRNFQITALKKAMSFPNVRVIVYSTCSLHKEENESVVAEALAYSKTEAVSATIVAGDASSSGNSSNIGGCSSSTTTSSSVSTTSYQWIPSYSPRMSN